MCFYFKSSNVRALWTIESLQRAVKAVVVEGMSKKMAAKSFGIPRATLQRHLKQVVEGLGVTKKLGRSTILTEEQEQDLADRIIEMENRLYGLTPQDIRRIVYQFCQTYGIKNNFNNEARMAGKN